jgi:DNA-binding GntR family transcriptional regulator
MASELVSLQNATNRAYRAIKEMIARYELVPGQKITYDQLVEKIKLSKTPIINALNRLEQEEFVFSIPNRGFFIKAIDIEEVAELFEVREALEMMVIVNSLKNQNCRMMKAIEKAMVAHREYLYDIVTRKRQALDATFHLKIAEMGGNKSLTRILKHVFEHIYLRHRSEGIHPQRLKTSAEEHQKIFEAIQEENLPQAKRLMMEHVRAGKTSTIKGIQKAAGNFEF